MSVEPDSLGLDKPIKLGRVSKIPKITDELLLDKSRGLPYVINNYQRVAKVMRKNDKSVPKGTKSRLVKVETEVRNLESVLEFYQLWCHGLFPKATFGDCIQMVRKYKSGRIRLYRRDMIDQEMHRQRVEKGIITENTEPNDENDDLFDDGDFDDLAGATAPSEPSRETGNDNELDEDDWGFLSVRRRPNGLFIGEEDEEDDNVEKTTENVETTTENVETIKENVEKNGSEIENASSDKSEVAGATNSTGPDTHNSNGDSEIPDMDDIEDDYDAELDVMREMGM